MPLAWNAGKIGVYQTHQHNSFVYKPPQPHRDQRENSCRANALFGKSLSERFAFHDTPGGGSARYPPQPTPSEMSLSCRAARRRDVRHFSTSLARQGSRENFGGAGQGAPPKRREEKPFWRVSDGRGARPGVAVARRRPTTPTSRRPGSAKPRAARVDGTPIPITRAFSTLLEAGKPRRRKKTRQREARHGSRPLERGWREKPRPAEPPARPSTAPAQVRPSTAP
ncbi:hypothetical protein SO694_00159047 [Aureococcus anophagefferens]|uniref:Uncharacterized protein n=1 Tax=Aureococcus anophagefferens TaxID=44056 RepID=A0ABR1G2K9_AURAN